jgi:hypothetical protein
MPTLGTYLRRIETSTFAGDFDVGEQFHNYQLHGFERACHSTLIDESDMQLQEKRSWTR